MARNSDLMFQLINTTLGYWRSQVLFTAHNLGVFEKLSSGEKTSEEVAKACNCPTEHMERLLHACVSTKLLKKEGNMFGNIQISDNFLVKGKPGYMGHWIDLMSTWYQPWGNLAQAIQTGQPVENPAEHLGGESGYTRDFIYAMHDYAIGPGSQMVNHLDLTGRKTLLDVGGGPGSYSILLAQKNPELKATVFDLPEVVEIAREIISDFKMTDRVDTRGGSYMDDDLRNGGSGYDAVLLSNMLHQEDPEVCKMILRKAGDALADDGVLVIQAMFLNSQKDGPVWPTLHSLLLSLVYHGGRAYSLDETLEMLGETGFTDWKVSRPSLLNAESLITARKA